MSKLFTLGFIFTEDLSQVYLLRKLRPDWQSGLLNGVGGKFKLNSDGQIDETPHECMEREAIEECNYRGPWHYVTQFEVSGSKVAVFTSRVTQDIFPPIAQTGERLYLRHVNDFQDENAAKCLVPMTLTCILAARNYLEVYNHELNS